MAVVYNIKKNNKLIKCVDFDSLSDQLEYITPAINNNLFNTVKEVSVCDDFYGKHTFEETVEGMKYGFQEDTNYFLDNIEEVKNKDSIRDGVFMDIEGFAYDMGSVVAGVPECCVNMGMPTPAPYIPITVDLFFNWTYSSKEIRNRGIAITNLINTLLINGCIVDLMLIECNIQPDMTIMPTVKIDTKTLSISSVAFSCTPEYFRKIGFITMDAIRNVPSCSSRGTSRIENFMVEKFKKEKMFYIGGSDTFTHDNLKNIKSANETLLNMFDLYCKENKIKLKLKHDVDKEVTMC